MVFNVILSDFLVHHFHFDSEILHCDVFLLILDVSQILELLQNHNAKNEENNKNSIRNILILQIIFTIFDELVYTLLLQPRYTCLEKTATQVIRL